MPTFCPKREVSAYAGLARGGGGGRWAVFNKPKLTLASDFCQGTSKMVWLGWFSVNKTPIRTNFQPVENSYVAM